MGWGEEDACIDDVRRNNLPVAYSCWSSFSDEYIMYLVVYTLSSDAKADAEGTEKKDTRAKKTRTRRAL